MSAVTDYITINKLAEDTGYTPGALHKKVKAGIWLEGKEYYRAPDKRILVSISAYEKWVKQKWAEEQNTQESEPPRKEVSNSRSNTKAQGKGRGSTRSPQIPTFL